MSDRLVCGQCNRPISAEGLEHPPAQAFLCPYCQAAISHPPATSAQTAITAVPPPTCTAIVPADHVAGAAPIGDTAQAENKPRGCLFALAVFGLLAVSVALLVVGNRFIGPVLAVAGVGLSFGLGIGGMLLAVSPSAGKQRAGVWLLMPFAVLGGVLLLGALLLFAFVILDPGFR